MKVVINKKFDKDVSKIKDPDIKFKLLQIIEQVELAKSVGDINNLKKLKGWKHYYRLRIGDYRIGVEIVGNTVLFLRFGHRQQIYTDFP
jgi:mRNA interferase RelE/StbE